MTKEQKQQVQYLLGQFIEGKASVKEEDSLFSLLQKEKNTGEWEEILEELIAAEEDEVKSYSAQDWQPVIENILRNKTHQGKLVSISWKKWIAAASVILLIGLGTLYFFNQSREPEIIVKKSQPQRFKNDVAPGRDGAILTLDGGEKIILDDIPNGAVATQGDASIIKDNGQLAYNTQETVTEVLYNTMTTPKGRQYSLILADGSKVWLNAASSIRFPTAFIEDERRVTITGEVYFEIAHNDDKPFIVQKDDLEIEVLGTHFNVNAYANEDFVKTTLLEGAVKVSSDKKSVRLKPGEQAVIRENNITVESPRLDEVVAWKNGMFQFRDEDIKTIMRQVERWYNVEVIYEGNIKETFTGKIPRKVNVSDLFNILESTGWVHFEIDGQKISVKP